MSVIETIGSVIETARALRDIAGKLNSLELKSQIIDHIGELQDARDQLQLIKEGAEPGAAAPSPPPAPKTQLKTADEGPAFLDAPSDGETYSFHVNDSKTPESESKDIKPETEVLKGGEAAAKSKSDADGNSKSEADAKVTLADAIRKKAAETAVGDSRLDLLKMPDSIKLTVEQQAKIAELRIKELEPKHHAAVKKLNEILTAEQRKAKSSATKAAKEAGKTGKELQLAVQAAVKLTDEQKKQMALARKELLAVRAEIAEQINGMLTDEQRAAVEAAASGDSTIVKAKAVKAVKVRAVKK